MLKIAVKLYLDNIRKIKTIVAILENIEVQHNICNLRNKTPKGIPVILHNGSTYDCHFIVKELVNE